MAEKDCTEVGLVEKSKSTKRRKIRERQIRVLARERGSCIMKISKQKTWQHKITGFDGNTILFGVNIFNYKWKETGEKANVRDPLYGHEYKFPVYTVVINGEEHEFVAGEFSNCVWGFFLLKY